MKKIVASVVLVAVLFAAAIAGEVTPAQCEMTNLRDVTTVANVTATEFYQGDTILFTNCVMYTGATTNSAVQDLDGCDITVRLGSGSTVSTNSGAAIVASNGTWYCSATVPAVDPCYVEVTVSNVSTYTYQQQMIQTKTHLGE